MFIGWFLSLSTTTSHTHPTMQRNPAVQAKVTKILRLRFREKYFSLEKYLSDCYYHKFILLSILSSWQLFLGRFPRTFDAERCYPLRLPRNDPFWKGRYYNFDRVWWYDDKNHNMHSSHRILLPWRWYHNHPQSVHWSAQHLDLKWWR